MTAIIPSIISSPNFGANITQLNAPNMQLAATSENPFLLYQYLQMLGTEPPPPIKKSPPPKREFGLPLSKVKFNKGKGKFFKEQQQLTHVTSQMSQISPKGDLMAQGSMMYENVQPGMPDMYNVGYPMGYDATPKPKGNKFKKLVGLLVTMAVLNQFKSPKGGKGIDLVPIMPIDDGCCCCERDRSCCDKQEEDGLEQSEGNEDREAPEPPPKKKKRPAAASDDEKLKRISGASNKQVQALAGIPNMGQAPLFAILLPPESIRIVAKEEEEKKQKQQKQAKQAKNSTIINNFRQSFRRASLRRHTI